MAAHTILSKRRSAGQDKVSHEPLVNIRDLLRQLGEISPERVRLEPAPGKATKKDLVRLLERQKVLCELVDGTLVEKPVGQIESVLASWLGHCLWAYLTTKDLGRVYSPDGPFQLKPRLIRLPDVAFVSHDRIPQGESRHKSVATWVPNLAVEILSKGNSKKEIQRKLEEYFEAGVMVVWIVDPRKRTVSVYSDISSSVTLQENETLEGGTILPGFKMSIREWFDKIR